MKIADKDVTVFKGREPEAPLVILNTVGEEGEPVYQELRKETDRDFSMAAVGGLNWEEEMTPWPLPDSEKGRLPGSGGGDKYLGKLTEILLPEVLRQLPARPRYTALAGYSLGGLFAVYAMYKTDQFARIASASGSLWYPGFLSFARGNPLMRKPDRLYFSLGNREAKTRNRMMKTVEENTRELAEWYKCLGIDVIYRENPGNHLQDAARRMAAGIAWILED